MLELELMTLICEGVDPRTGELLGTPRDPRLDTVSSSPRRAAEQDDAARLSLVAGRPIKQGARWLAADDQRLREAWLSEDAPTAQQIAELMGRNRGGIMARLLKLGICADSADAHTADAMRKKDLRRLAARAQGRSGS